MNLGNPATFSWSLFWNVASGPRNFSKSWPAVSGSLNGPGYPLWKFSVSSSAGRFISGVIGFLFGKWWRNVHRPDCWPCRITCARYLWACQGPCPASPWGTPSESPWVGSGRSAAAAPRGGPTCPYGWTVPSSPPSSASATSASGSGCAAWTRGTRASETTCPERWRTSASAKWRLSALPSATSSSSRRCWSATHGNRRVRPVPAPRGGPNATATASPRPHRRLRPAASPRTGPASERYPLPPGPAPSRGSACVWRLL